MPFYCCGVGVVQSLSPAVLRRVAEVAPGGRYEEGEPYAEEFDDRKHLLTLLAEASGGAFTAIE